MTKNENWIDKNFDELRTRGAGCSKSFYDDLEERMMQERVKPVSRNRRVIWTVAISLFALGIAGGAYAGGNVLREWMYGPFLKDADGTIRNAEGEVVGGTVHREDGTSETTITVNDSMIVLENADLPRGAFSFSFEPNGESTEKVPVSLKGNDSK